MQEEQFDIVHAHGTRAMSNVFWAANSLNIPLLYTVHGWSFHPDQSKIIQKVRELSEKLLTSKADLNICVSRSNEVDGQKRFRIKRSTVIYNAVDLKRFNYLKSGKDVRKELNISKDKVVIGFIVRITGQKDPMTMVRAMSYVVERNKNAVLLVVGEGDLEAVMQAEVKMLNLEDNVVFQPFRSDIPDVLNAIDIYCLPSLWEGFPIGILEAMAMKKAVVASPVDGNPEIVEHRKTGFLVENENPEKLAETLSLLVDNDKLRKEVSENGYDYLISNFGINRLIKEVQNVYSKHQTRFV